MDARDVVEAKYRVLARRLDESLLRLWAAVEARSLGRGGVSLVAKAVGISRTTIYAGLADMEGQAGSARLGAKGAEPRRIRAPGGGRKRLVDVDESSLRDLDGLVEPSSRGDPMSALG